MVKIVLVTGCVGFIGSHVAERLLKRGDYVIGVDEMNDYYDIEQKIENLKILKQFNNFIFYKKNISNYDEMKKIFEEHNVTHIAHLAARAGVRPSIEDPFIYCKSNIDATLNLLELSRLHKITNFALTSSSSVYGNRSKIPFIETDNVDNPVSPYAATKKSCELLAHTYHDLYGLNINILRPFTIYGPRGRPDMAPFLFVDKIHNGKEIKRFGDGSSQRDYTYIDDFVSGFVNAIDRPLGYEIFNLGNSTPVKLNEFIGTVEEIVGKKAKINQLPMQPGDVLVTFADTSKAKKLLDYEPTTTIKEGLTEFYKWYKDYKQISDIKDEDFNEQEEDNGNDEVIEIKI